MNDPTPIDRPLTASHLADIAIPIDVSPALSAILAPLVRRDLLYTNPPTCGIIPSHLA